MFYDFVQIILKDKSMLFWIKMMLYSFRYEGKHINVKELLANNDRFKETDIKGIILIMHELGVIRRVKEEPRSWDTYEVDYNKFDALCDETLGVIKYLDEEKAKGAGMSYKLVAKLPNPAETSEQFIAIKRNTELLYDAVLNLISAAQIEIIILNPFFDDNGIKLLCPEITKKLLDGVNVNIITRYSGDKNKNNRKSLNQITKSARLAAADLSLLRIYDYNYESKSYKSKTFHAKAMIIDQGKRAYIGSANLTGWGLDEQLELGTLLQDKNARILYNIILYLSKEGILKEITQPGE